MNILSKIGEFGFIKKVSKGCFIRSKDVIKAIGDDCAVFKIDQGKVSLVTTDMLVERVHFLRDKISGFALGYKALSVSLSDVAAMGGTARESFISIAIPESCDISFLEEFYSGMKKIAVEFDVNILGGDTTSSKSDLIINIVVFGEASESEILYRDGAKPGDIICSSGFLGDSKAGLYIILNNIDANAKPFRSLVNSHYLPKPYLKEGRFLSKCDGTNAAIDVSDGLTSDLFHIVEESKVGVRIFADKIPISQNLNEFCKMFSFNPLKYALSGGEDYVLLCTLSKDKAEKIIKDYQNEFGKPLYAIGEVTDSKYMELVYSNGNTEKIYPMGWDHFKLFQEY